jgi:murein DD-endopeptidase MepM/ murein hydrolase activator NlpD
MARRVWFRRVWFRRVSYGPASRQSASLRGLAHSRRFMAALAGLATVATVAGAPVARNLIAGAFTGAAGSGTVLSAHAPGASAAPAEEAPLSPLSPLSALAMRAAEPGTPVAAETVNRSVTSPPGAAAIRAAAFAENAGRRARLGERWPTPPALLGGYRWPLPHGRITNGFGPSVAGELLVNGARFHDGVDLATFCGDHVVAAHDGVVLSVGRRVDPWLGWIGSLEPAIRHRDARQLWGVLAIMVVLDDGNGYRSIYAHFNAVTVHTGDVVRAGQFIGWEGSTGAATGCHLHYGLFSPAEAATMRLRPDIAKRTKLPEFEIGRVDPLLVLPPR